MADLSQTARNPSQDFIRATPRNPVLGFLSDLVASSYDPQRTQQMQGMANFFGAPAISQTLDRLSFGEPLTTGAGGLGGTTRIRPEALEAGLTVAPFMGPAARMTKGLPVGMGIKGVGKSSFQTPIKEIRRYDDGAVDVGYMRGDSKMLVTIGPQGKDDKMLSASLENMMGYPTGTGDATRAYVDALESVLKNSKGRTVYWDGFTSETIQSDAALAIYDRLKAAGIPFEKNVFEGRNPNALSLTQEQLFNIDFDKVRKNLDKIAITKQSSKVPQSEGVAAPNLLVAEQPSGPKQSWDAYAAQKAKMLEDMGRDPKSIWQETGTWRGTDGQLRQEIMP